MVRQDVGERVVLGATVDEVMALVNDDGIPMVVLEMVTVQVRILQRVDGDDDTLEVGEGVTSRRQLTLNSLDPS